MLLLLPKPQFFLIFSCLFYLLSYPVLLPFFSIFCFFGLQFQGFLFKFGYFFASLAAAFSIVLFIFFEPVTIDSIFPDSVSAISEDNFFVADFIISYLNTFKDGISVS